MFIFFLIHNYVAIGKKAASNSSLSQGTIETGNKRRPVLIKKGSQKFEPLPPEPPDPNSGYTYNYA